MNKIIFTFKRSRGGVFIQPDVMSVEIEGWTEDELRRVLAFAGGLADRGCKVWRGWRKRDAGLHLHPVAGQQVV